MNDPSAPRRTSTPRSELERIAWPTVDESFLEAIRTHGEARTYDADEIAFEVGDAGMDFLYLESGSLDVIDRATGRSVVSVEAGHFVGELGMLMGQDAFLAGVARSPIRAYAIPEATFSEVLATVPAIGDVVVPAFIARRRLLLEWHEGGLVIAGRARDRRTVRLIEFLERSRIPHRWIAPDEVPDHIAPPVDGPIAILGHSRVLESPTPRDLATALGLDLVADASCVFDVVIVGAGPAGLAAAVYAASEGLGTLVVEDTAIGGQAGTSSRIENYLGFPTGISGSELAHQGAIQAFKFGARLTAPRRATELKISEGQFHVVLDDERCVRSRSVVLATGLQYRRLPIDGLADYEGQGVYYAATDLEARFCRGKEAVVIGGGNSAGQAAMFLSKYASRVHLVVRGDGLSATMSSYLSDRILRHARIELRTRSEVVALEGDGEALTGVIIEGPEPERSPVAAPALFVMVGATAITEWLGDLVDRDRNGMVLTGSATRGDASTYETRTPGVFAVGDVRAGSVKRVASAVGEGSVVVADLHAHLANRE